MNETSSESVKAVSAEVRPGARMGLAAMVLLPVFVAFIGYGLVRGDVFETYQNGSNL